MIVDANVVLRYLLKDTYQAEAAREMIEERGVSIPGEVLAEVVYVLEGVYDVPRKRIAETLKRLMALPTVRGDRPTEILEKALDHYAERNIDYVDALLCAWSSEEEVATFDKKLQRCVKES